MIVFKRIYNLKREECIFIDDSEININGVKSVNIEVYLFDGDAEKLMEYIELKLRLRLRTFKYTKTNTESEIFVVTKGELL